jgi:hypothetical protein
MKSLSILVLTAGALLGAAAHGAAQPPATGAVARVVTVWLKLAGDPVAVVRSRAPGRRLSPDAEKTLVAQLRAKQTAIIPSIEANGGRVLGATQYSMNAIKVAVSSDNLDAFRKLPGVVAVLPVHLSRPDVTAPGQRSKSN